MDPRLVLLYLGSLKAHCSKKTSSKETICDSFFKKGYIMALVAGT